MALLERSCGLLREIVRTDEGWRIERRSRRDIAMRCFFSR
jgi:hypothetical protein